MFSNARTIKDLFNILLQQEAFPNKIKLPCVTTIFKNLDKSLLASYRSISILLCFSKLLERIMYNRLYKSLIKTEIFYGKQF